MSLGWEFSFRWQAMADEVREIMGYPVTPRTTWFLRLDLNNPNVKVTGGMTPKELHATIAQQNGDVAFSLALNLDDEDDDDEEEEEENEKNEKLNDMFDFEATFMFAADREVSVAFSTRVATGCDLLNMPSECMIGLVTAS